ncbi:MAG TPA: DUF3568 family protein [Longimicrobium sp.]|nr:DUF3568 family protein [Longimicrobium sp.]
MTRTASRRVRAVLVLAALAAAPGCATAALAGAGAAAGIHMTGNSAESPVRGSLAEVDRRTRAVLAEMRIQVDERKEEPSGFEYKGSAQGMEIRVELDARQDGMTQVKASARKNAVEWNNDYARDIVARIAAQR